VERALLMLGLSGYENRCPHHLSYGEKKKASMAAVMSMEPKMLVLDEPTANLDPRSRAELIGIIKNLNEREGIATMIAMHDVNAVPALADRIYVLNKKIIAEGTLQKIFSDFELLKKNNLEVPEVFKLFEVLRCFGYDCEELPLSIDEAIEHLTRTVEIEGGHIHLHIHEHTHDEVRRLKDRYEHHYKNTSIVSQVKNEKVYLGKAPFSRWLPKNEYKRSLKNTRFRPHSWSRSYRRRAKRTWKRSRGV